MSPDMLTGHRGTITPLTPAVLRLIDLAKFCSALEHQPDFQLFLHLASQNLHFGDKIPGPTAGARNKKEAKKRLFMESFSETAKPCLPSNRHTSSVSRLHCLHCFSAPAGFMLLKTHPSKELPHTPSFFLTFRDSLF